MSKKRKWKKELVGFVCFLLVLGLFCAGASAVVLPKRYDYGATWDMYLKEEKDSVDVMFFGSSLAYCDVVPSVIYETSGNTAYVMAGPEQTLPITWRYLKQACKTQSPQMVFIEATGLLYAEHNRSTHINICYMPWSLDRLELTFQEATPEEQLGLLFPLASYHSRWTEITWDEVGQGLFGYGPDMLAGYTFLQEVCPVEELGLRQMDDYPEVYQENLKCVQEILDFCDEEGIRPVFFVVPNANRPTDENMARLREDITALGGEFWDCNQDFDQLGIDLDTDFYDTLHFNYRGAEKLSRYLGEWISQQGLKENQNADQELWQQRVEYFNAKRDEADSQPIELSGAAE